MNTQKFQSLMKQVYKFNSLSMAQSFADNCTKIALIVLGDDGKFWVSTPRVTEQLVKLGYQYA